MDSVRSNDQCERFAWQLDATRQTVDALEQALDDAAKKRAKRQPLVAQSESSTPTTQVPTTKAPTPAPTQQKEEWHPWDRAPPPPEARILQREHWKEQVRKMDGRE